MLLVLGIGRRPFFRYGYRLSGEPTNGVSATTYGYLYIWKNVARWLRAPSSPRP
jgi:hypothetical protein